MSSRRGYAIDSYNENHDSRTRSTSTASSSRSSSSRESGESLDHSRRNSGSQSLKPKHHKSGSFGRLFSTKEPSLDSFKQLAELQQKELERRGEQIPFGVSSAKIPVSAKDDYKKAKQRAKERAKLHEVMRDKMRLHDDGANQHGHARDNSSGSLGVDDERLRLPKHQQQPPKSPRTTNKRFSALEPLPEATSPDGTSSMLRPAYPPSPPPSTSHTRTASNGNGILTGSARKEALPWE